MKKIDSVVIEETRYIAIVTGILSVLMQACFLVLSKWDYTVLTGNLLSEAAGILNFFLIGLTVQKALQKDEKDAKAFIKMSQTYRMFMLFAIAAVGIMLPWFNNWSVIIPLLFPRIAIALHPFLTKEKKETQD